MVVRIGPGPDPGWLIAAVGIGLEVVGWYQISGQPTEAQQLPYLASATIPGAALIVAGTVMVAAHRIADAAGRARGRGERPYESVSHATEPATAGGLWALPEGSYVHRPDCPLIDGKPEAFELSPEKAAPGKPPRRPCPICDPNPQPTPEYDSVTLKRGDNIPDVPDTVTSDTKGAEQAKHDPHPGPYDSVTSGREGSEAALCDSVTSADEAASPTDEGVTERSSDSVTSDGEGAELGREASEGDLSDSVASAGQVTDAEGRGVRAAGSDSVRSSDDGAELQQKGSEARPDDSVRSDREGAELGREGSEGGLSDSVASGGRAVGAESAGAGSEADAGSSDSVGPGGADSAERG